MEKYVETQPKEEKTVEGQTQPGEEKTRQVKGRSKTSREKRRPLDVACAVLGAGAVAACLGGALCGCSSVEKLEQPVEVVSIEVVGTAASAGDEENQYVVKLANPDFAPNGMEALSEETIAEVEDILTSRITVGSDKTGVARAYLKSGEMNGVCAVYTAKVAGGDVYVVKVFDNGSVIVLTPKEQAEQEARDAEDAAEEKALEEAAANARYALTDAKGLKEAGVPASCASRLPGEFAKWCKKGKLQPINSVTGADVESAGKTCTVRLFATDVKSTEGKTVRIRATWNGKKLSFAKEKVTE